MDQKTPVHATRAIEKNRTVYDINPHNSELPIL